MKAITYKTTNAAVNAFVRANAPAKSLFTKAVIVNEKATCFEDSAFKIVDGNLVATAPTDPACVIDNTQPGNAISVFANVVPGHMAASTTLMPYRDGILWASNKFHAQ